MGMFEDMEKDVFELEDEKVKKHEKIILECKDPEYSYKFSSNIKGADIKAHERVVIESKNPEYCYLFAKDIEDADIEALQEVVIRSKNPKYCYLFALNVKGADIERLRKIVMKKDKGYKALFIENIDNKSEKIKEEELKQESAGDTIKRLNKMLKR